MSIQSEINRINQAKADILSALTEKGVDTTGKGLSDIAGLVAGIQSGGGGGGGLFAKGSITPTSNSVNLEIVHNLGVVPNLYVVICSNTSIVTATRCLKDVIIYCPDIEDGTTYVGGYKYSTDNGRNFSRNEISDILVTQELNAGESNPIKGATDSLFYIGKKGVSSAYDYKVVSGWIYEWIAGVI